MFSLLILLFFLLFLLKTLVGDVCLRPTRISVLRANSCNYVLGKIFSGEEKDKLMDKHANELMDKHQFLKHKLNELQAKVPNEEEENEQNHLLLKKIEELTLEVKAAKKAARDAGGFPRIQWLIAPKFVHVVLQNQQPTHEVMSAPLPKHLEKGK